MKKFTFLIILTVLVPSLVAQELKQLQITGNPKKLESGEMAARRDANGNYCAAIQVISDMSGFSYDSWNGVVGDVDSKPGKDMVFLTADERVLEIFKEGCKPLKIILSDYGINMQPREVWQIEIAGEEKAETLPVVIRYTPEDAQLSVDGVEMEKAKTYSLAVGEHQVKIIKDGYQEQVKQITVDQNNVLLDFELERIKDAALQLTTTLEGAIVYIDGIKMGETPVAAFHPPGTYPIRLVKEGFVSIEDETIEIVVPTTRKDYKLEENVGYLTVNTHENATVYFNGETITNPDKVKLFPQLVKVKVTMPKADDIEQQVLLKKDDDIVLNMYPEVKTGTIQVAVTPFDAKIELTGDAGEYYTSEGMKVFEGVPVGHYELIVSKQGFVEYKKSFDLKNIEIANLNVSLSKPERTSKEVYFSSSPSNAKMYINGKYIGLTPCGYELIFGTHLTKIIMGDQELTKTITVDLGSKNSLHFNFPEIREKTILITNTPPSGTIYINDKFIGFCPKELTLKYGEYKVKVIHGANESERVINVNHYSTSTYDFYVGSNDKYDVGDSKTNKSTSYISKKNKRTLYSNMDNKILVGLGYAMIAENRGLEMLIAGKSLGFSIIATGSGENKPMRNLFGFELLIAPIKFIPIHFSGGYFYLEGQSDNQDYKANFIGLGAKLRPITIFSFIGISAGYSYLISNAKDNLYYTLDTGFNKNNHLFSVGLFVLFNKGGF